MATGYPHSLILIGAEANAPEIEYGWIEPGRVIVDSPTARLQAFLGEAVLAARAGSAAGTITGSSRHGVRMG
jgi:hypothetical protein